MSDREWPELECVLCGLIVLYNGRGSVGSFPFRCPQNAGGDHIQPGTPAAERAKEIRQAWMRDPMGAPSR